MLSKILLNLLFIFIFLPINLNAWGGENLRYISSLSGKKLVITVDDKWRNIDNGVDFKSIKLKRSDSGLDIIIKLLRMDLKLVRQGFFTAKIQRQISRM